MKSLQFAMMLIFISSGLSFCMDLLPGMAVSSKGILTIDGITLKIVHYDDKWGPVDQSWLGEKPFKETNGVWKVSGVQPSKKGDKFNFTQTIQKKGEAIEVNYDFKSTDGVDTNVLALNIDLPVMDYSSEKITIDDEQVMLPPNHSGQQVFSAEKVKQISIPLNKGKLVVTGSFNLYIQDSRQWKGKAFQVRIGFPIERGEKVKETGMSLKMELKEGE